MKKIYRDIFIVAVFTAIMGQIHFYPFNTDFRLAFGVIIFPFLLLYFHNVPIIPTAVATATCIFALRFGIDGTAANADPNLLFYKHFPAFMYYISYGIIVDKFGFRKFADKTVHLILILSTADISSNFFELIIRNQLMVKPIDSILSTIFLTAFMRAFFTLGLFWIIKYYNLIIIKEEHQKRYKDLLMLTAKLKSEILFLKKSMQDIENAMEKSYSIYNTLSNGEQLEEKAVSQIMEDSLNLSIDIHEIKKDYHRIVSSIEKIMPAKELYKAMKISDVFDTIRDIFVEYLDAIDKDIELELHYKDNFETHQYFVIMSILNNLIQNSIEASLPGYAFIKVNCYPKGDSVVFTVCDNGKGIMEKDMECIFEPGFTTKYDPETGYVSTGLGLAHVNMLLLYLEGSISINSEVKEMTEFVLEFPKEKIIYGGDKLD